MNKMNKTSMTTLGAMTAAVSVIIMLLTIVPVMTYSSPMLAGMLLLMIVIEMDKKWGYGIFAVVSVLSLILAADKQAVILYIMFFGHYPVTKAIIEGHIHRRAIEWLIKFAVFNVTMTGAYLLVVKVFAFPMEEIGDLGKYGAIILLIVGNIVFPVYDVTMTRLVIIYNQRVKKIIRKVFR